MQRLQGIPQEQYKLGIDIGGGTLKYQLFHADNGLTPATGYEKPQSKTTERGLVAHTNQVADIIVQAEQEARKLNGELASVGIGSPGRFRENGTLKPGTNSNIELPGGHEFDDCYLHAAYLAALKARGGQQIAREFTTTPERFVVRNDGDAAMLGVMNRIKNNQVPNLKDQHGNSIDFNALKNHHVAYIGIGTGVGHAIMHVDPNGGMDFKTDGHASKLWIDTSKEDIQKIEDACGWWNAHHKKDEHIAVVVDHVNHRVRAEDLLRAPIICSMAEVMNGEQLDTGNETHQTALKFSGKYLARLMEVIRSGQNDDVNGEAEGWTPEDKTSAARTSDYIIGGGIMNDAAIAKLFIDAAQKELATLSAPEGATPIRLIAYSPPDKESPAITAAAGLATAGLQR